MLGAPYFGGDEDYHGPRQDVTLAISTQQFAFCNEDLHWLDINDEDVND
jgi:hypothetical protein